MAPILLRLGFMGATFLLLFSLSFEVFDLAWFSWRFRHLSLRGQKPRKKEKGLWFNFYLCKNQSFKGHCTNTNPYYPNWGIYKQFTWC